MPDKARYKKDALIHVELGEGLAKLLVYLLGLLMLALLAVPLVLSLLVSLTPGEIIEVPSPGRWSLRWYERFFNDQIWQTGALNSALIALLTTLISLLIGTSAALAFERYDFRFKRIINLFILLPLFVPPALLGMQNLAWHQRIGIWGSLLSLAMAHSLWAMPLVFTVMRAALKRVDRSLEEAARGMGASPVRVFWEITLPLIRPGLLVAAFFAFIISINEFVMALFLATPRVQTLPTLIYPQLSYNLSPLVAAASAVLLLLTMSVLLISVKVLNSRKNPA
ncbi:MAG TPA: ABC transporter permease [Chloroflexia bacterium]|nr:ABC transporter permease [Chloroflexia bacterium]